MEEIRIEKKCVGRTTYNYADKKFIIIDDKLEIQCSGKNYFVDRTYIRAYDSSGNYLQDVQKDGKEYSEDFIWTLENPCKVLVQIGFEFILIPTNGASNVTEIWNIIHLFNESNLFPYKFNGSGMGSFRSHDICESTLFDIALTKREISKKQIENLSFLKYKFNGGCEEFSYCGNHLSIMSDAQDNFDIDKYTENYKKALITHPNWKREIERLYLLNVGIHKWKKHSSLSCV